MLEVNHKNKTEAKLPIQKKAKKPYKSSHNLCETATKSSDSIKWLGRHAADCRKEENQRQDIISYVHSNFSQSNINSQNINNHPAYSICFYIFSICYYIQANY